MATNKHATIRYHALDQCFNNSGRKYYIDDLIEACNTATYNFTGIKDGVKRRQIFEDIKFMESEQGWSIPLERVRDGKKVFYRYFEKNFSLKTQGVNDSEVRQIVATSSIFTRFKGLPQFEWIEELLVRIESTFKLKGSKKPIVSFEQNQYLKGMNYFTELFNGIQNQKVLEINYQSFKQIEPIKMTIHPYYLKQYNSRWFLFGHNEEIESLSNLALDRILGITELNSKYVENESVDFEEYFEDIVGVTVNSNKECVKIVLQINKKLWPYIETKPIHGSQKIISKNEDFTTIELNLVINYELAALIFSLGEEIKVIAPKELKDIIKTKADSLLKNYL